MLYTCHCTTKTILRYSIFIRYLVKTSQSQNVPSDLPKRPKYIFTIFNQTQDSKHFLSQSQKHPKSKRPKVKMSQVKTSQSQNVPSQNVPKSKCPKSKRPKSKCPKSKRPKSKRPKVKTSQVKMSHSQNVPSQYVPSCLSACKQHYSHSYEALY